MSPEAPNEEELLSLDGKCRAIISRRPDGLFSIEVERHGIENAQEYGKFEFWATVPMMSIVAETIERARELAEEALRDAGATGLSVSS
jgi:hypothetical protein